MKKKIEKQIQEEIRRRVLKHDEATRQRQELEMDREANREALAELTSLSRQNVDQIAKQVRAEFAKKRGRKKKFIIFGVIILLITIRNIIVSDPDNSRKHRPESNQTGKIHLVESFTNNKNNWPTGENYEIKRYFQDGRYIYANNNKGFCSWDQIPVKLPANYEIELTSVWLKGQYDEYGFMLIDAAQKTSFYSFQINADGSARVGTMVNNEWARPADWTEDRAHQGDGKTANTQRLKVKKGKYDYFVNDISVARGLLNKTGPFGSIAVRNCGEQTVGFDHLKISSVDDTDGVQTVMDESFDTPVMGWTPKSKLTTHRYFENNMYYYRANKKGTCFFTAIDMPLDGNFEVSLKSIWKKGEQVGYGLVLAENFTDFLVFQLQNTGHAQYTWYSVDKYKKESGLVKCGHPGDGEIANVHRVRVKKGQFKYYVNNKLAATGAMPDIDIKKIGVRVCGRQTVAFDNLKVKRIH